MENVISWGCDAGRVVDDVVPGFVGLAVTRLLDEGELKVKGDQLLVMCLNVVLSALRYNANILIVSMEGAVSADGEWRICFTLCCCANRGGVHTSGAHVRRVRKTVLCVEAGREEG